MSRGRAWLGWLLPALILAVAPRAEARKRLALVVGVNDGGAERTTLRYATSDAAAVASVLETLGGVEVEDRWLLLNADRSSLATAMRDVTAAVQAHRDAGERVELVVYYSGHSDEDGLLLGEERFTYRALRGWLDALPADVRIAILDSCASGALTRLKGGTRRPGPLRLEDTEIRGYAYLTSASATEAAQESDRLQGSFFTHYLVSGLLGAADFSKDGRVSLNEAYQFAYAETLARTRNTQSGPQHASYDIRLAGAGDVTLTDLRVRDSGFSLDEDIAGRVFFNAPGERLVAELRKFQGDRVELALPAGDYEIFVANGSQRWSGWVRAEAARRRTVALSDLAPLDFEQTLSRGPDARLRGYRAQLFDETPTRSARTELVLFQTVHGILIGSELCLAFDCDDVTEWSAMVGLGGGLGLLGSLASSRGGVTPGRALTLNSGFLWGLWHGAAIGGALDAGLLDPAADRFASGQFSAGLIAGQVGGMGLAYTLGEVFEPTAADVSTVNTAGLWAGLLAFAAQGSVRFPGSDETTWLTTLIASDLGAVAGGVLARYYPISRSRALVLNAGGLLGAVVGIGTQTVWRDTELEDRSLYLAGGLGAAVGLGVTAWLTQDWDWEVPGSVSITPTHGGAFAGFALEF